VSMKRLLCVYEETACMKRCVDEETEIRLSSDREVCMMRMRECGMSRV